MLRRVTDLSVKPHLAAPGRCRACCASRACRIPTQQVTGAVRVASWAGMNLTAVDVSNLRLALIGLLPNLAGLVMAFGVALRGHR